MARRSGLGQVKATLVVNGYGNDDSSKRESGDGLSGRRQVCCSKGHTRTLPAINDHVTITATPPTGAPVTGTVNVFICLLFKPRMGGVAYEEESAGVGWGSGEEEEGEGT